MTVVYIPCYDMWEWLWNCRRAVEGLSKLCFRGASFHDGHALPVDKALTLPPLVKYDGKRQVLQVKIMYRRSVLSLTQYHYSGQLFEHAVPRDNALPPSCTTTWSRLSVTPLPSPPFCHQLSAYCTRDIYLKFFTSTRREEKQPEYSSAHYDGLRDPN